MNKFFLRIIFFLSLLTSLEATDYTLGGVTTEGALKIVMLDNAKMKVYQYVSGVWKNNL